jgi:hypothetical protein
MTSPTPTINIRDMWLVDLQTVIHQQQTLLLYYRCHLYLIHLYSYLSIHLFHLLTTQNNIPSNIHNLPP